MDAWIDIRRKARECHKAALTKTEGDRRALPLVMAALKIEDLETRRYEPGSIVNEGVLGFLDRESMLVNFARQENECDEVVVLGHELGHYKLHKDPMNEVTVGSAALGGDSIDMGVGKVEGYSSRERKEVQADVFSGEFFCPADWIREQYVEHGKRPSQVASELGLPTDLVLNQFIRALLLPPLRPVPPEPPKVIHELDKSQQRAATWSAGPLLVDAGPGTGKTRTLVRRIAHLLEGGASPASILALTFSNKAAEEMRERLSALNPDAAIEMWVGTFHSFGLELVTKWPSGANRSPRVRVFDPTASLSLLEANLARLPLKHYLNLYDPAYDLVNILRVISRCKDELIPPERYLAEAEAALAAAATPEDVLAAEKAVEVGRVYQIYEEELRRADAVDFGDLVLFAVKMTEEHPEVISYVQGFTHVLVDEYQDVNLASARLLKAICKAGACPWVVADERQSIYRFRGAEPTNVSRFVQEFRGARHSLSTNYRSFAPVVRTFEKFSAAMGSNGSMAATWLANRGSGGGATLTVTPSVAVEAEAIRDRIEEYRRAGVPYSEQAILARTHLTLARITGPLERLGVPLLYLGDLFERDEIRNLLSLAALDAEYGGIGLVRVATLPEYGATRADALTVIRWSKAHEIPVFAALKRAAEIDGLSDVGRQGLQKLGAELDGLTYVSPWKLITTWLFERSDHLRALVVADGVASQQKRIAIYHFLKVCADHLTTGDLSRKGFVQRIRRIEILNQDTAYRAVASEAEDLDAVRVLTVHGSKGLEFRAVHLPALATKYLPVNRQGTRCPPPRSLSHLTVGPDGHKAEEQCLFFVAISRARDHLSISRAERYTTQKASESTFLVPLRGIVVASRYDGVGAITPESFTPMPPEPRDSYDERELEIYMKCPARYRYEVIEQLHGSRDESPYIRFHRCVYATVGWLEEERREGRLVAPDDAAARLRENWRVDGPGGHPFEAFYWKSAEEMVRGMAAAVAAEQAEYEREEWGVPVGDRLVKLTADRVVVMPNGTVRVQRLRTGRATSSEAEKTMYALLRRGAAARYPGRMVVVETFYLGTGESVAADPDGDDKSLGKYSDAIDGIEAGRFAPDADARKCPTCQCYFMCKS